MKFEKPESHAVKSLRVAQTTMQGKKTQTKHNKKPTNKRLITDNTTRRTEVWIHTKFKNMKNYVTRSNVNDCV